MVNPTMKKIFSLLMVATACLAASARIAQAQDGRSGGRGGPEGGMMRFDRILAALNTDGDNVISAAELDNAAAALKKLDKNGDGKLTEDELRPNFEGGRGPGGPGGGPGNNLSEETIKTLMEFDRNGDGKLSKEELPERMQGLLARGDANKDGFLTREELKTMADAQSSAGAGRPGEGRMGERGARPEGRPDGPGGRERGGRMITPAMAALDANGDGTISADEISNAPAALKKLDKDGDGKLTEDEVRPNFDGRRGPGGPGGRNTEEMINHLFEENDKNGDGKLSKDELPERMQGMFERGDTDKDGFLSKEELKKLFESQGGGFGPGRPAGRDGEGRPQRQRP